MSAAVLQSQQQNQDAPSLIHFKNNLFEPLPSGALYWPDQNTLLVADLHLEKMSSFAKFGQLLPPYDTRMTLTRLERDIRSTKAKKVICLGDSFHRDDGTRTLLDEDKVQLRQMVEATHWIWLAGNHDPSPHALGGVCHAEMEMAGIVLCHEPSNSLDGQIAGHLHPAARVLSGGRSTRRPCFAYDENLMILPAYGASTGSINVLSEPFEHLWNHRKPNVVMLGKNRVYAVSSKRLVHG